MRVDFLAKLLSDASFKKARFIVVGGRLLDNNFVRFLFKVGLLFVLFVFGLFLFFHIRGKTISVGSLSFVDLYPSYKRLEDLKGEEIIRGIYMYNTGALHLRTLPRGVDVYLDNKFIGRSSYFIVGKVIDGLLPGEHVLNLTKEGFLQYKRNFTVWPRHVINIDAILLKKPIPEVYPLESYITDFNLESEYKIVTSYLPDYLVLFSKNNQHIQLLELSKRRAKEPLFYALKVALNKQYEYRLVGLLNGDKIITIIDREYPDYVLALLAVDRQDRLTWVGVHGTLRLMKVDGNYRLSYVDIQGDNQVVPSQVKDLVVVKNRLVIILQDRVVEYVLRDDVTVYRVPKQTVVSPTIDTSEVTPWMLDITGKESYIKVNKLAIDESEKLVLQFDTSFFNLVTDKGYYYVLHVKSKPGDNTVLGDVKLFDMDGRQETLIENLYLEFEQGEQVLSFNVEEPGILGDINSFVVVTNKRTLIFGDIIPSDTDFVITETSLPFTIDRNIVVYSSNIRGKEVLSIPHTDRLESDPIVSLDDNYIVLPFVSGAYVLVFNKVKSDLLVRLGFYRVCDGLPVASETILGVYNGYLFSLVKDPNKDVTVIRACEILGENDYDYYKMSSSIITRDQIWLKKDYIFWIAQEKNKSLDFVRIKAMVK